MHLSRTVLLGFAAVFTVCDFAVAALAPPSLKTAVTNSDIVATLAVEAVSISRQGAGLSTATVVVRRSFKGANEGERLTIEFSFTVAEGAEFQKDEECLVFLRKRGDHCDVPFGMFGKFTIKGQKVMAWSIGRTRQDSAPLESVVAEIQEASR